MEENQQNPDAGKEMSYQRPERAKRWARRKEKPTWDHQSESRCLRVEAILCAAENCWKKMPTRREALALIFTVLVSMALGVRVGSNWVEPAEKVVVFHCPAGGADTEGTSIPDNNFWAGPPPEERAKEELEGPT